MGLKVIKGSYDSIFSLGDLCLASIQLKKNSLRNFSGVLDWMASPSLPEVSRLLRNEFNGFLDRPSLRIIGYASQDQICVSNDSYQMVFNHDFGTDKNTLQYIGSYDEVKEKYDRRIKRTLEKMKKDKRLLFVRTEGTFEEVLELHTTLSSMVKNDFRILVINHKDVSGLIEKNWPIEGVCAIDLPNVEKWEGNDKYWKMILEGVHLTTKQ
jgi:hypothetical protein